MYKSKNHYTFIRRCLFRIIHSYSFKIWSIWNRHMCLTESSVLLADRWSWTFSPLVAFSLISSVPFGLGLILRWQDIIMKIQEFPHNSWSFCIYRCHLLFEEIKYSRLNDHTTNPFFHNGSIFDLYKYIDHEFLMSKKLQFFPIIFFWFEWNNFRNVAFHRRKESFSNIKFYQHPQDS